MSSAPEPHLPVRRAELLVELPRVVLEGGLTLRTEVLRSRRRQPTGGTVEFVVDGRTHEARWDVDDGGWVATVGGVAEGDEVTVPEGGLVDGLGNRSGDRTVLTVGEVADVEWPPNMGVGGGRPPGPGGVGTFPPR